MVTLGNEPAVPHVYPATGDCPDEAVRKERTMGSSARFVDEDTHLDFSKVVATDGQVGYDIAGLLNKTGNVMIDPGSVSYTHLTLPTNREV